MQLYQLLFPNGKKYIGITSKTAQERFKEHCKKNKYPCQKAIKKYGKENVVITVLGFSDDWELLCLAEIEAIDKFNTICPNGYNLTLGGEGVLKFKDNSDIEKLNRNREYNSQWRSKNKDKIAKRRKIYNDKNKDNEDAKIKRNEWRINNKEKMALYQRKYRNKLKVI